MDIRFIKEYRALQSDVYDIYEVGTIENMPEMAAQWLIDNGFAEEVEESGWKPKYGEKYFYVGYDGFVHSCLWENDSLDNARLKLGSVFKTEEATERYRDYLEAIATVSQDDGFMRKGDGGFGWPVIEYTTNNPGVEDIAERQHAGEFYFDTREHALNSAMNHTREWQTILNYDWSKGEDKEDSNED